MERDRSIEKKYSQNIESKHLDVCYGSFMKSQRLKLYINTKYNVHALGCLI